MYATLCTLSSVSYTSVPGAPQSLRATSVTVTGMTIQWDRVNCQNRNGPTGGYRVSYYPTSNPYMLNSYIFAGTGESDRILNVTGLPPRTKYTFKVQAYGAWLDIRATLATINVTTSVPQSEFLLSYVCVCVFVCVCVCVCVCFV